MYMCVCICVCVCVCVCAFSWIWLFVTIWTITRQAPLSIGFSRQDYWSGLLFPPPEDLPNPRLELVFSALQVNSLSLSHPGNSLPSIQHSNILFYCILFYNIFYYPTLSYPKLLLYILGFKEFSIIWYKISFPISHTRDRLVRVTT